MKKIKVLIVYNKVWSYRLKIFGLLNEEFDLTVGFSDPNQIGEEYPFKTMFLPVKQYGPFEIHKSGLKEICNDFDVIVGIFNIRWLSLMKLSLLRKRSFKLIYWGIGVRASYNNSFDSPNVWDQLRFFIAKKSDAVIFYSSYPIKKYLDAKISAAKMFVANNTTYVVNDNPTYNEKKDFLFIGTLYAEKGIDILLDAYFLTLASNKLCPKLYIVGDGPLIKTIQRVIEGKGAGEKIFLLGSIYDPQRLSKIYNHCIACISPQQAGLSVLNSMGNATMFITKSSSITGGEIFNIESYKNGITYDGDRKELSDIMNWVIENREKAIEMCRNAKDYYETNRTPELMAKSIIDAITYSINKNV